MIRISKINNENVNAIPLDSKDDLPALGYKLFNEPYANIFLCAKKKSGKTSVIYHLLKNCCDKTTTVVVFCSTLHKDQNWSAIKKYCLSKKMAFEGYTSMKEDGVDLLTELLQDLQQKALQEEEAKEEAMNDEPKPPMDKLIKMHNCPEEKLDIPSKKKKKKWIVPEYVIILDDLSTELKSPALVGLLKSNRHYKMKIIISSQYYLDLLPASRKQIDYFIVFKSQHEDKLMAIYKDADLSIDYPLYLKLYNEATKEKYGFFYIDTNEDQFRIKFDKIFELPQE